MAYDVARGNAQRLLERDRSVSDKPYRMTVRGRRVRVLGGLYAFHPALDTICLDAAGEWLYFGAMSHESLFRVRTRDLDDVSLSPASLSARVEIYGPKIQSNGASIDTAGNVYMADVEHGAIAILRPGGRLSTLIAHPRWRWPDGLSFDVAPRAHTKPGTGKLASEISFFKRPKEANSCGSRAGRRPGPAERTPR